MQGVAETSPRSKARTTGAVYLFYFLTAIFAQVLVNHGFALYGLAANLIATAFYIVLTLLFYFIFKPVNKSLSLVAALFSLVGCAITALSLFNLATHVSPLLFFAPYCLLIGFLILRSTFLPQFLGVLMVLAGLGWLIFLALPPTSHLSGYVEALGILGEGLLMLWLLVMGVNAERWRQQASAAESRS